LFQLGALVEAEEEWKKATALPNAPHYAFAGYAIILWKSGKHDRARVQYKKAARMDRRWRRYLNVIAEEYHWTDTMIRIAEEIISTTWLQ